MSAEMFLLCALLFADPPPAPTLSQYLEAGDGTRLAADVYLPEGRKPGERVPALLTYTRYVRSLVFPDGRPAAGLDPFDRPLLDHGYAIVKVDARGSGASFGTRAVEYGPEEVGDSYAIIDWIASQTWCDGNVGAYGISYTGTTADLVTSSGHPALKAVSVGWSDFDQYRSPTRPYGLVPVFIKDWSRIVAAMDHNDPARGVSTRPVDGADGAALLEQAVAEHRDNPDVFAAISRVEHIDSPWSGEITMAMCSALHWKKEIEASKVPMLVMASWLDAGTADGALTRLEHFSNPQKVVIFASSHGGMSHASPYRVSGEEVAPDPPMVTQHKWRLDFFDHHLRGKANGVAQWPRLRYYTMGEEKWHTASGWPVGEPAPRRFYPGPEHGLSLRAPSEAGSDRYRVDFAAGTGPRNRWMTQLGLPVLDQDARAEQTERLLCYTSPPLEEAVRFTGRPVVSLEVTSDHEDGALLVYLEDVAPDGKIRYLSEGGLRLIHRKRNTNPHVDQDHPYHSFARADSTPMPPGEPQHIALAMWPVSVLLEKGHRIRLSIAGADTDSFVPIPERGTPTLTISWGENSYLEL